MNVFTIYSILLFVLYALLVFAYARVFAGKAKRSAGVARSLLLVTLVAHICFFVVFMSHYRFSPMKLPAGALSALALGLTIAYALIEWITGEKNLGVWVLILPAVFQLIASIKGFGGAAPAALPASPLVGVHVGMAIIGYCALSLSAALSLAYLLLYQELKMHRLGLLFERLPSLESLEDMAYRAVHFGLGFLLVALCVGEWLLYMEKGRLMIADAKIVVALLACIVYGAAILLRRPFSIRGKRFAMLSIAGFALILFSLFFVDQFFPGFHQFQG